jgi:hypothetical protein
MLARISWLHGEADRLTTEPGSSPQPSGSASPPELGNDHYVIVTEKGWTTEHSIERRLSGHMHKRAYDALMARFAKERGAGMPGRLRIISLDGDGEPVVARADLIGENGI